MKDEPKKGPLGAVVLTLGKGKPKPDNDNGDTPRINAAKGVRAALDGSSDEDLADALETFLSACKSSDVA